MTEIATKTDSRYDIVKGQHRPYCVGHAPVSHSRRRSVFINPETPDIAFVPLTRGRVAIIDAADADRVGQHSWQADVNPKGLCYAKTEVKRQCVMLHRFLLSPPPDMVVDHINGDGLDNRRANLRICTQGENLAFSRQRS